MKDEQEEEEHGVSCMHQSDSSPDSSFILHPSSFRRSIGRRVLVYDRVESTNSLALELASDPASEGVVLVAREQSAGRGQHGRTWVSPAGSSVLLSAVLFPPPSLRRPAILTAWAAVSVCETIRETTGLEPAIKWPNDVFL